MDSAASGLLLRWRLRLGVRLLRPHWLPTLEHYNDVLKTGGPNRRARSSSDSHVAYIVIGIKHAIGVGKEWSRY